MLASEQRKRNETRRRNELSLLRCTNTLPASVLPLVCVTHVLACLCLPLPMPFLHSNHVSRAKDMREEREIKGS